MNSGVPFNEDAATPELQRTFLCLNMQGQGVQMNQCVDGITAKTKQVLFRYAF